MKIGIVSDTHGSLERWTLAYEKFFKDVDLIVHAGDVLYHGPRNPILSDYNPGKLAEKINRCSTPILLARGNCDAEVDAMVLDAPILAPYGYASVEGFKIVVTHGHLVETEAEKLAQAKQLKADLFITGHTHVAGVYKKDGVILLNPGSPSMTKREDQCATIAIVTDEKIEIIDIDTEKVIESLRR